MALSITARAQTPPFTFPEMLDHTENSNSYWASLQPKDKVVESKKSEENFNHFL